MTTPQSTPADAGLHVNLVRAQTADLDTLSQVIADAFHGLAPSRWLVADPAARRDIFPAYFRLLVEHAMASGVVHTTTDRTAAALWIHVGERPAAPHRCSARKKRVIEDRETRARGGVFRQRAFVLDGRRQNQLDDLFFAQLARRPRRFGSSCGQIEDARGQRRNAPRLVLDERTLRRLRTRRMGETQRKPKSPRSSESKAPASHGRTESTPFGRHELGFWRLERH